MPGLLKKLWNATDKMRDSAKQHRVEKKLRRSFEAAADNLDSQRDKAKAKIESMLGIEELLKLDDGKDFDVNEYRRLRNGSGGPATRTSPRSTRPLRSSSKTLPQISATSPKSSSDYLRVSPC